MNTLSIPPSFQGRTAAVIGLARAGIPAAKFLLERGAKVVGFDGKTRGNLAPEALELEKSGATLVLGDHGFAGIENCDLIVLSPGLKIHFEPLKSIIEAAEARGAEVIGELELASRFCPCPIIGVTGTKGKSTVTKLITEMLRACGVDAISAGNTGTPLIEILPMLKPESWAVVEVSSFQLEKAPTFRPKIAVLLSLLEDHQDYHPTLEQYWETKLKIFDNQEAEDYAIYNVDDARVEKRFKHLSKAKGGFLWSINTSAQSKKTLVNVDKGIAFFGTNKKGRVELMNIKDVTLSGKHNLSNLMAAFGAVGVALEFDFEGKTDKIAEAIRNFKSLPHRLEIVAQKDGIAFVNDSQSTIPDAAIAALRSFPYPVTLLVGGRAKIEAAGYEALMSAIRDEKARLVLFGEAKEMLYEVALSMGVEKSQINRENTLAEALKVAKMNALPGETVILSPACASFDQFTSYEHRGETFRQLVREV